jgi:hypothetical protein
VPWDDDWKPPVPPDSVEEALAEDLRFWPTDDTEGVVGLFKALQSLAGIHGRTWHLPSSSFVAFEIARAIRAYAELSDSHGLEPRRLEDWLKRSRGLARELSSILRSKEGQERFAHVIERGYPQSEVDHPLGPELANNTLLRLLDDIANNGPMTPAEASNFALSDAGLVRSRHKARAIALREMPLQDITPDQAIARRSNDRETKALRFALASQAGTAISAKRKALYGAYKAPAARDPIRRQLLASTITAICSALGDEARRSLITGRNRPWSLLQEMTALILEYVGHQRGAPPFAPGQETGEFRFALAWASIVAQDDELCREMRQLAQKFLHQVPTDATDE